jgi:hypothetical protein
MAHPQSWGGSTHLSAACAQIILQAINKTWDEELQKTKNNNHFSLCDIRWFSALAI